MFLSKELKYVMSLKIRRNMAYSVCNAAVRKTSMICYQYQTVTVTNSNYLPDNF